MSHYSPTNTSVVLLAAGRGSRMRSLTETTPKPLLKVGPHTLIEHHLYRLQAQGFKQVVINLAYLGEQIRAHLGDGSRYGLRLSYSDESATGALETAGGLKQALPLIESDPFLVINSDIWTDFSFNSLLDPLEKSGRVVLVDNPEHNPLGDFGFEQNQLHEKSPTKLTFSGIALYKKSLFSELGNGKHPLGPVLRSLIHNQNLEGIKYIGDWTDVGTPERLSELNKQVLAAD